MELRNGNPVMIGGKKKDNGKQHWILIYGSGNTDSLKASNFTVYDPAFNYTDLGLFLADFNFYKFAVKR